MSPTPKSLLRPGSVLRDLPPYVFGSMSLGREDLPFATRVAMARHAMERCSWFHTSHKYGTTIDVLAEAFRDLPGRIPQCIFKLSGDSIDEIRRQVELQLRLLDRPRLDVGQVHLGGALAQGVMAGDRSLDGFRRLKEEGLVGGFTLEVHPWTSGIALAHLRSGEGRDVFEGFSFYYNPLQRYALNALFALIEQERRPILSIRTVAGGPIERQAARPASAADFLQRRAAELLPLYRASGRGGWTEFCMDFLFSHPQVLCTIGACSTPDHLAEYLSAVAEGFRSLPAVTLAAISAMQARWSDEKDRFAPEWSM